MRETMERTSPATVAFAWFAVGLPLVWGVVETLVRAAQLFR